MIGEDSAVYRGELPELDSAVAIGLLSGAPVVDAAQVTALENSLRRVQSGGTADDREDGSLSEFSSALG